MQLTYNLLLIYKKNKNKKNKKKIKKKKYKKNREDLHMTSKNGIMGALEVVHNHQSIPTNQNIGENAEKLQIFQTQPKPAETSRNHNRNQGVSATVSARFGLYRPGPRRCIFGTLVSARNRPKPQPKPWVSVIVSASIGQYRP